ncbi:MAG: DUF58 domain-containing protein [Pyrinomonadaceae bacterium]|nr:DUF58 domain-containing protein [Pyrinomonadaceae bacterium]
MRLSDLRQIFSLRDLRNAVLGLIVIFGGIGLAALTLYAHRTGQPRLAGLAAAISLVFVVLILIFVVPPLARNASKEASQLNLPFELTIGGAIMLGLIVIVGFSAWNTGNNLLFLVLSFLAAAMIVGFFAGGISLKKLDVKMRFPETIFAGEATPILVSLQNRKRLFPSYSVVAEVRGTERERSAFEAEIRRMLPSFLAKRFSQAPIIRRTLDYFVHVPRNETAESRVEHIFPHRGRFLIKDFEISTKFPFAFFRHRRRLAAKATELIVFPKLETIDPDLETYPLETGNRVVFKRGSGQDLLALRGYHPNDDLRRVDWKATARSRDLVVREFSAEDDRKIVVAIDTRLPASETGKKTLRERIEAEQSGKDTLRSERFEAAVTKAASIIAHFTEEQAEITLVIDGDAGEPGIGNRHLHDSLRRLAVIEPRFVDEIGGPAGIFATLQESAEQSEESHIFLLTAAETGEIPAEIASRAKIVAI